MALKGIVDSIDEVPEPLRPFYAEKDGKHVLAVDGFAPKAKVDEFRDSNVALKRELDELRGRFDGIDPDEARKLFESARKQRDGQLLAAGKVDELVTERTNAMKASYDAQLKALQTEKAKASAQLEELVIGQGIRDAAMKAGVRPTAIDDVLLRGRQVFRMQDGKAQPFDGDKPIYGKEGAPMEIAEWIGALTDRAPHLFEQSSGSGAKGAQPGAPTSGRISRDDHKAFLANLDKIAAGKIEVN